MLFSGVRDVSIPPLVRKASAIAFQVVFAILAEDLRSEWLVTLWRRAGPGSSSHCGIPASRIQVNGTTDGIQ